jgi:sarcosine oxidase, subunit beta
MSLVTADVVVVGAGVNGAATAFHLVEKGLQNVLIIDCRGVSGGMTGKSSTVVRQHYGHEVTAVMARDSLRFFERFDEVTGGYAEFKSVGMVGIADDQQLPTMRDVVEMQRRVGINTRMVSAQELRELEPEMDLSDVAGGCHETDSGYADPVGTCAGFVRWATEHGAKAWLDTAVQRIVVEGGSVAGVATSRGVVKAERVVLAAGPWIVGLAHDAGVDLPIRSSRHPVLVFKHKHGRRPAHIIFDVPQSMYTRPEGKDLTLVGTLDMAHSQEAADPDSYVQQPTFDEVSRWGELLMTRFPDSDDVEAMRGWCGIYEYTPDWHHIIDELPTAHGCYVVCGTSGHGFKLGPAVGDITSDLVLGRTPRYDVSDFRLDRFGTGHSVANRYAGTIIG